MRLCLLPTDLSGVGCYRVLFPGRELAARGHDVFIPKDKKRSGEDGKTLALSAGVTTDGMIEPWFDADVYVLQIRVEDWMAHLVAQLREAGKAVVYEVDDWYPDLPPAHPATVGLRNLYGPRWLEALLAAMREADVVTVSTEALADGYAKVAGVEPVVLPNLLDWGMWRHVEQQSEVDRPRRRVGWMGAAQFRGRDLGQLRGVIGPWLERHPDWEFVAAGDAAVFDKIGVPEGQRFFVGSHDGGVVPFAQLPEITATMDVGLVPLADTYFNECKTPLKGMEYAACGIPCIATPSGPYREWVDEGVNGLFARKPADWWAALDQLAADDTLRRQMGRQARAKAAAHTIQEGWRLWEDTYSPLVREAPRMPLLQTAPRQTIMSG